MASLGLVILGVIIGTVVIALGGGDAAFYLGILSGGFHLLPATAAATSIVTALPSLSIGSIIYTRQKRIDFHIGNQMLFASLPAVVVGSLLSPYIPNLIYTWLIGIILIFLGIKIFLKRKQTSQKKHSKYTAPLYGVIAGLMVGVAGLSGGGPILAGLLLLGLDTFRATATSTYVLVGMTAMRAIFHIIGGKVYWQAGVPLIIGAIIGAFLAPLLVKLLDKTKHPEYINYLIAVLLVIMGANSLL